MLRYCSQGTKGARKGRSRSGCVLRMRISEMLTMRKSSRNVIEAPEATSSMGSRTAITMTSRPLSQMAQCGVLLRVWMRPKTAGRSRSRPMAKETRLLE